MLANELSLCLRQPLLRILMLLAPLLGIFVGRSIYSQQAELFSHAHQLNLIGVLSMMALPWTCGLLAVFSLYRATNHNMTELVATTSLSLVKQQAVQVRGLILQLLILGVLATLGVQIGLNTQAETIPDIGSQLGIAVSLQTWQLVVGMPAVLLFVAVFWLLRNLSTSTLLVYLAALLWFVLYSLLAVASASPLMAASTLPIPWLYSAMSYFDWFGMTALMERQPNASIVITNRLLILMLACAIAGLAIRLAFRPLGNNKPALVPTKNVSGAAKSSHAQTPLLHFFAVAPKPATQLFALTRLGIQQVLSKPVIWLAGLIWCLIVVGEVYPSLDYAEQRAMLQGLSLDAINRVMWDMLPLFGSALMLYFSDALHQHEKKYRIDGIVDALPIAPSIRLAARVISLCALLLVFLLLTMLAAALSQWLKQSPVQWTDYLQMICYAGLPLAATGMVFLAIHASTSKRWLALLLSLLLVLLHFTPMAGLMGLHHPLFRPFATPLQPADTYLGYQASIQGFWAFICFWLLVSGVLLLLASQVAGRNQLRFQFNKAALLSATLLLALLVNQFLTIQSGLQLNGLTLTPKQRTALLADYERQYQHFAAMPMPQISKVTTQVDFYPHEREVRINGQYTLHNHHQQAIDQILVGEDWRSPLSHISLMQRDNPTQPAEVELAVDYDARQGQRLYTLSEALQPGQSLTLHFTLMLAQNGYSSISPNKILTKGFNYLRAIPHFPSIGYQSIRQISNQDLRRQQGLPTPQKQSIEARLRGRDKQLDHYQWSQMETRLSTPLGYQGFTQGELVKSWQLDGRQYRLFKTRRPVRNVQGFIAAPLTLSSRQLGSTLLQVAHLPQHQANVPLTLDAMADTVAFLSEHIGPYNGGTLTLVEKPDIGPTGYALPQLMLIGSRVGFRALQTDSQDFSQAYRRTVHETAHQWFGHWLGNGIEQDSAFMVESLAKYVELVMLEQHQSPAAMQALVAYERQRFLAADSRRREAPVSLISAEQNYDQYSRATLVFARLRQEVGDAPILQALKTLGRERSYPAGPASSLDFVQALLSEAPGQRELIERLFTQPVAVTQWLDELNPIVGDTAP